MSFFSSPVLKVADFRRLLLSRLFVTFSLQIQAVIVGWQIYQIKPDPLLLGLIGLTEAIPAITAAFYSGHVVDTQKPYRVIQWSFIALLVNTLFLLLPMLAPLVSNSVADDVSSPFSVNIKLFLLFTGIFISGAARSFISPAYFSLIPQILPKAQMSSAAAFNSSTYQFASVIGPAIGGLIYAVGGPIVAFCAPPLMMILALVVAYGFSAEIKNIQNSNQREPFWQSLTAGLKYTFQHKMMLSTMCLDMFSVLFGGAVAMLPIFADQVFHTGSMGLGILRAAPAAGSVLIGGFLAFKPLKSLSGKLLMAVIVGFGLCTIGFSLSTNIYLSVVLLALSGAFDGVSMVIRGTFFQAMIPDHMRGRISALNSVFITSSNEIGSFESGVAASLMGLVPSVFFGGAMTLVVVGTVAVLVPGLAKTSVDQEGQLKLGS
ncbi:MAG: MFS transporter [Pseudobdellovibrionaceae bacterium]